MAVLILGPIVGAVSATGANLWGRADGPGQLRAWLGHQADLGDAWLAGESQPLTAEYGFAGVAPVTGLASTTQYHYLLSLSDQPPDPALAPYPAFTTLPPAGMADSFAFAFGSCFRPEEEPGGQIFHAIAARRQQDDLRFILLLGDQIYADDYRGNGIGKVATSLADYRAVYSDAFAWLPFRELLASLPAFMTLDDHEVDDDWTWKDSDRTEGQIPIWDRLLRWLDGRPAVEWQLPRQRVQDALQAYWEHQGMHAPPLALPDSQAPLGLYRMAAGDSGTLAYTFSCGAAAFFIMDTRTMRIKGRTEKRVLGEEQWQFLENWLLAVKDTYPVKFLISSSTLLFDLWLDFARDRWSGFPDERERLLRLLADHDVDGVYVLAGDLHSAHAVHAELNGRSGRKLSLWEFCATPFQQTVNHFTSRTYRPFRSATVNSQRLYFTVRQHNFGLVRVDFSAPGNPRVRFEVYGKTGELLGEAG